jgi:integrase
VSQATHGCKLLVDGIGSPMPRFQVTVETVDRYSRYRLEVAKNSSVTVNGDLRCLRRALKLGVKWGRLKADDAVAINELPEGPSTRRAISPKEEQLYLRHASSTEAGTKSPYVFPGNGDTGRIVSLQHPHEQAIKKAKLKPFEFYCWRHTFGTRAAMAGVDKFALCKLMGHSSPTVTEKY